MKVIPAIKTNYRIVEYNCIRWLQYSTPQRKWFYRQPKIVWKYVPFYNLKIDQDLYLATTMSGGDASILYHINSLHWNLEEFIVKYPNISMWIYKDNPELNKC